METRIAINVKYIHIEHKHNYQQNYYTPIQRLNPQGDKSQYAEHNLFGTMIEHTLLARLHV